MAKKKEVKQYPPRLKRADSFLGIHFDFHAGEDCKDVGKNVSREMVETIIKAAKPDYVQCDCKGHPGFSSYPTKVGNPAPGFAKDPLRIWRDVTAENGVALYMHYSGVWDTKALKEHPDWALVNEKGGKDPNNTSVFGPYVDELLIPQFKELSDVYGVDGVWVDGECWATCQDWSKRAVAAFKKETGITTIPKKPGDPYFFEYTEFCRRGFMRYLNHYVEEIHKHNPNFQVASNWCYSSFTPEPATIPVDFISGDYPMQNSIHNAAWEARCMALQGKPWDLMAWSFSAKWGERCYGTKQPVQMMQEAAAVLSVGGGFQAYFTQKRDGSICEWQMKLMAEVAEFCRARQKWCHHSKAIPQVALLYSGKAFYRKSTRLYGPWGGELVELSGVLRNLLDSQNSVEIVMEHHLEGRMQEYPLIVIPDWEYLESAFQKELLDYVKKGGNLLLVGPKPAALFTKELGVTLVGEPTKRPQWLEFDGWLTGLDAVSQEVKLGKGTKAFGMLYGENDSNPKAWNQRKEKGGFPQPAASIAKLGKGKIAATYVNLGERYLNGRTATSRKFLNGLVRELFPKPFVEVTGSGYVEVMANRINGKIAINLTNVAGPHADANVYTYDEIPALGPISVALRVDKAPKKATLQPSGKTLPVGYENGLAVVTVPRLEIHEVVVFDE